MQFRCFIQPVLLLIKLVQLPGRAERSLHLIGRAEGREIHLELVLILPVEQHLLKPVAPQHFCGQVRRSGGQNIRHHSTITLILTLLEKSCC